MLLINDGQWKWKSAPHKINMEYYCWNQDIIWKRQMYALYICIGKCYIVDRYFLKYLRCNCCLLHAQAILQTQKLQIKKNTTFAGTSIYCSSAGRHWINTTGRTQWFQIASDFNGHFTLPPLTILSPVINAWSAVHPNLIMESIKSNWLCYMAVIAPTHKVVSILKYDIFTQLSLEEYHSSVANLINLYQFIQFPRKFLNFQYRLGILPCETYSSILL